MEKRLFLQMFFCHETVTSVWRSCCVVGAPACTISKGAPVGSLSHELSR
jgi:hypothetical protein